MDEKPKSIWEKSRAGWRGFLLWFILFLVAAFLVIFSIGYSSAIAHPLGELIFYAFLYAICWALAGTVLIAFIRWICCWRNFKRFLFGLACFATLIALFYAEENWRGKRDWENYKRDLEAKGEKMDFADFIPSTVPNDQNFAMAPVFAATRDLASRKWRNEHRNLHPENGNSWDTNLVDPLQIQIGSGDYNDWPTNVGNWQLAKTADLNEWQNYYRALAAKTNEFPIAPQPQTPAQDILLALSKYDPVIEELRDASKLPYSRFPLDYDDEDPAEILLPHLGALKKSSQVLQLRALAELENNETDKAFDDVKLSLRLVDCIRTEPFIITHLVRRAILLIALQPVYEGLAEHKWSDAQLAEFDAELAKINFLADYEYSTRSERAAHAKILDWMEKKRSRFFDLFNMITDDEKKLVNSFGLTTELYLMPHGWFYQSDITMSDVHQHWIQPMVDEAQQTVSPELARKSTEAVGALKPTAMNLFARLLLPELGTYAEKVAHGQTAVNEARIAIALERYRLAHGSFPESLDALAPQYLEKIPHDVIGGQSLKYRRTDDGQFVLYSVGWNETDDGGVAVFKKGSSSDMDISAGDWVWQYPAK